MDRQFVLDTNVLIHDPEAIFKFAEHDLFIPIFVIEEIDQFKRESTERGRNCRHICRLLDDLRANGNLSDGVPLGDGKGRLTICLPKNYDSSRLLDHGAMDRAILETAISIKNNTKIPTVLVTMDTNLRIRADALGMPAEMYESSRTRVETISSVIEIDTTKEEIDKFFTNGKLKLSITDPDPNASILLRASPSHTALARFDSKQKLAVQLRTPREGVMNIRPKNKEQAFAIDMLLNDEIQLVTLLGKAGSGKTLISLAAGLQKIRHDNAYSRMLVSRPIMPLGRDIGYLPGDVNEKMNPWIQPIFDNLDFIFGQDKSTYKELMDSGVIQVEPLTYIRGRSLPYQFIICDEVQNMTHHEILTLLTRAGEGSKIILTGDPDQIDNPYVDSMSNGLSIAASRFQGQAIAGTVNLVKGERSLLADLATQLLV